MVFPLTSVKGPSLYRKLSGEVCARVRVCLCTSHPSALVNLHSSWLTRARKGLRAPGLCALAPPAQIFIQDVFFHQGKGGMSQVNQIKMKKSLRDAEAHQTRREEHAGVDRYMPYRPWCGFNKQTHKWYFSERPIRRILHLCIWHMLLFKASYSAFILYVLHINSNSLPKHIYNFQICPLLLTVPPIRLPHLTSRHVRITHIN